MTDIELVRMKISDNDTPQMFTDAQITGFLTQYVNVSLVSAMLIRAIIAKASLGASLSEGAYSRTHNLTALENLAKKYEDEAAVAGYDVTGEAIAYFDIAEEIYTEDNAEQILSNQIIRNEIN